MHEHNEPGNAESGYRTAERSLRLADDRRNVKVSEVCSLSTRPMSSGPSPTGGGGTDQAQRVSLLSSSVTPPGTGESHYRHWSSSRAPHAPASPRRTSTECASSTPPTTATKLWSRRPPRPPAASSLSRPTAGSSGASATSVPRPWAPVGSTTVSRRWQLARSPSSRAWDVEGSERLSYGTVTVPDP